jgi:hypothetical protein
MAHSIQKKDIMQKREEWMTLLVYLLGVVIALLLIYKIGMEYAHAQGSITLPSTKLDKMTTRADSDAITLLNTLLRNVLLGTRFIFEAVAVGFMVYMGAMMVMSFGNEDSLTKYRTGLVYSILGFLILNFGGLVIDAFNPGEGSEVVDIGIVETLVYDRIITFIRFGIGSIVMAFIVYKGFKLITSSGSEEEIAKDKQYIMWAAVGLIIITIARPVQLVLTQGKVELGNELITTFTRLMMYVVPPIAIFFILYGAVFMLTAMGDEDKQKKGIQIIKGTVIALAIIFSAYTVVAEILRFVVK